MDSLFILNFDLFFNYSPNLESILIKFSSVYKLVLDYL